MIRDAFLDATNQVDHISAGNARLPANGVRATIDSSNDLVARAFAILDQDTMRTNARSLQLEGLSSKLAAQAVGLRTGPAADLQLQRRVLSDGAECSLPIRYFDVQCLVATFLVASDRASEVLRGTSLQAVIQEDGKAIVDVFCIEYRKTDIGSYNEVGLTVRAKAPTDPVPANYVVHLPVTTAIANRAGREIWGYNKFVATIDVISSGKTFSAVLRERDGCLIGALTGLRGMSVPTAATDILTFTIHQGRLTKTVIRVLTPSLAGSGDGFVFKIGMSGHPMTDSLRTLALDGVHPVLIQYIDPFQALLFPGVAL
jgi:hypothetical protein